MEYLTLKDIALINMGQSPDSKTYNEEKEGIPFYQGKSDFGKINPIPRVWCSNPIKIAEKDDILISVRAPIGDTNIATEKCCIGRGLASIRPLNENVNKKYLYYLLNSKYKELNKFGTGSTFKAITKENLCNLKCAEIPDIKEQIEVVKKLDNVSQIIEIKKKQLEELSIIIKSQFVGMFKNKNYEKKRIGDFGKFQGGYAFKSKDFIENGIKLVQISNVNKDNLDWNEINRLPEEYIEKYKDYVLNVGDVVMAMTRPIIKSLNEVKIAYVSENDVPCLLNQRVGRFLIDENKISKFYLTYCCKMEDFKNYVEKMSGNSLQPNISSKQVEDYTIEIPPIELQNQFADMVKQIDKQKFEIENSLKEMQELYEALMERYFG